MTSRSGRRTASIKDAPTLPAAVDARPADRKIASSMSVVVVLPLVPVTHSQGAAPCAGRIRQANSSSPQMGISRCCAETMISAWGGIPGDTMYTSVSSGADELSPRRTSAPSISSTAARSRCRSPLPESMTVTSAPTSRSASAAANPAMPMPATTARRPLQSEADEIRPARSRVIPGPIRRKKSSGPGPRPCPG